MYATNFQVIFKKKLVFIGLNKKYVCGHRLDMELGGHKEDKKLT